MFRLIKKNNKLGFILIEMIAVMGIFSIATVIISAVYLNANNLHQNTISYQRLQNDGRYMIEKMAREIRGREIDWDRTLISIGGSVDCITFKKDEFGEVVKISLDNLTDNLRYIVDEEIATLNASDAAVTRCSFSITPNPSEDDQKNYQPKVTILLQIKNRNINPKYEREITLQTTISSRVYKR